MTEGIYKGFIWFCTIITGVILLLPLYWIFLSSITPYDRIFSSPIHYIPTKATLDNYANLFSQMHIGDLAINTLIIIFFSLVGTIAFCFMAAYAIGRIRFTGSGTVLAAVVLTGMLPVTSTIIPLFQLFRELHLAGTFIGLIILYISGFIPFTLVVFVNFLAQLPKSLEEAAMVDGAGMIRVMLTIVMPLMKPAIATMTIIIYIQGMNEFMLPLIFGSDKNETLSVGLSLINKIDAYEIPWDVISAMGTLVLIPIVVIILFFERQIMGGLIAGGVKG